MKRKPLAQVSRLYSAPALEKGLDILELFGDEAGGLSKSDVARRLDLIDQVDRHFLDDLALARHRLAGP